MKQFTGTRLQAERIIQKIIIIIKQKKRGILTDASFLLVGKTIQCYTEHEFDAKSVTSSEKTAGICQYTRTCAAGNSGRMERKT